MKFRPRHSLLVLSVAFTTTLVACAGPGIPPPIEPAERPPYVIGQADLLAIQVWNNKDINVRAMVRSDGKISIPLLDDVHAEGLTPEELKEVITQELSEFITAPDVTVIVHQINSKEASILGAVGRTRRFEVIKDIRVLDAIASSGGFGSWAKKGDVKILRPSPDGIVEYQFDYKAYVAGKAPESNILIRPGDTIIVPD